MAEAAGLRRLLRVLTIEEDQAQLALEAAVAELHELQAHLQRAMEREHSGREWLLATAGGETCDRFAGLEEIASGQRAVRSLRPRIAEQEQRTTALREAYMAKRVERRQAEALIAEARAKAEAVAQRRSQQVLDDRHLGHLRQSARKGEERAQGFSGSNDET